MCTHQPMYVLMTYLLNVQWQLSFVVHYLCNKQWWGGGGCSSAGRAGRLAIGRSLAQIPAPGRAELHGEVSLSKILNPTLLTSEGPAMS